MQGLPPTPGWYIASAQRRTDTYRWYNGLCWSEACKQGDTAAKVLYASMRRCNDLVASKIEWIRQ